MTRPTLHLVDAQTGEIEEGCEGCGVLRDQLAGAEKEVRRLRADCANLARDREADAHNHELWAECEALFGYWKVKCRHPRSRFTFDRFEQARSYLNQYGAEVCRRGVDGLAYDPYRTYRKNGTVRRHDGWDLLFRNGDKFEEAVNKAPREST